MLRQNLLVLALATACSHTPAASTIDRTYASAGRIAPDGVEPTCVAQAVDPTTCVASDDAASGADGAGMAGDATGGQDGGTDSGAAEYGPTHKGNAADDDDCKYRVAWQSSGNLVNSDVYFLIDVTLKADGKPASQLVATHTPIFAEVYVDNGDPVTNHAAPNSGQTVEETATPGRYVVGPIHFDQVAKPWTVRFHLYGNCDDGATSPHGHVAFYFDVVAPGA